MERICWICLQEDLSDIKNQWVRPCKCKGSTKWVHKLCFIKLIESDKKIKLICKCCMYRYKIKRNEYSIILYYEFLEHIYSTIIGIFSTLFIIGGLLMVLSAYSLSIIYCFVGMIPKFRYNWWLILHYFFICISIPMSIIGIYSYNLSLQFQILPFFYLLFYTDSYIIPILPFFLALYRKGYIKYIEYKFKIDLNEYKEEIYFNDYNLPEIKIISYLIIPYLGTIIGYGMLRWVNIRNKPIWGVISYTIIKDIINLFYYSAIKLRDNGIIIINYEE